MKKSIGKLISLVLSLLILVNSVCIVSIKADDGSTYKGAGTVDSGYTYTSNPKSGSGNTYKVYKGYFSYPSAAAATAEEKDLSSVFYYSDGYFFSDSSVYDTHLSSMSLALAMTGFHLIMVIKIKMAHMHIYIDLLMLKRCLLT